MPALTGKTALVTGASRGIGRAVAERLARDGAAVVVNYVNSAEKATEVVAKIESDGGQAAAVQADVGRLDEVRRLFDETMGRFERLDIFVNNAATAAFKPIVDTTEEEFDRVFALNVKGAFFAIQEAAHRLEEGGRIIYISSSATALALSPLGLYVATKSAMEATVRILAKEIAPRGVTVNSVSPGYTDTDMLPADPEWRATGASSAALGRLGDPAEVADVVAFLAGPDGRWMTGQNLQAGGGLVI